MTETKIYPTWKEIVEYSESGPIHKKLIESDTYKAVLVGLEAGQKIPPHPSTAATYHFLEGSGAMIVDGERLPVEKGATVVVPSGSPRGVEAVTRLTFLGSHGAPLAKENSKRPYAIFGLMALFMGVIMIGLMLIGASPMAMMLPNFGSMGLGVWGTMILPMIGLLGMIVMMFFMFRWMRASNGGMAGMMGHQAMMSRMMGQSQEVQYQNDNDNLSTLTYKIPGVNCDHCKMTIEREVGQLTGVASVNVDVDAKQAVIKYDSPATRERIEARLAEIGYPPESK